MVTISNAQVLQSLILTNYNISCIWKINVKIMLNEEIQNLYEQINQYVGGVKMKIVETDFFILYSLDDGIYAAISKPGQGAWSNAGIVDLGDEILVFDSFTTPSAGYELRKQAEEITGKNVKYLINSHYHGDHVFGNQAFMDTAIISTALTKKWCKEKNQIGDLEKEKIEMEKYLNNLKLQIKVM